jgi:hypothetical protein
MNHLRELHSIGPEGIITRTPRSQPSTLSLSRSQSVLDGYYVAASERNAVAEAFDYKVFKGLLTRLFTVE